MDVTICDFQTTFCFLQNFEPKTLSPLRKVNIMPQKLKNTK
jgi:hypothetical protein